MLKSLSIENIAVIKKVNIELSSGFNALTGETGAGKSILIDSINAVLGVRTSRELIRSGCDSASVTAVFSVDEGCADELSRLGVAPDENGELFLCRSLSVKGGNSCRINGTPVPTAVMREVGDLLVNIHGQHDNRNLLDPAKHLYYLDKYAGTAPLLEDYHSSYVMLRNAKRALKALEDRMNETEQLRELYEFQKRELEGLSLRDGERDELALRRETVRNARKIAEALERAADTLSGGENGGAAAGVEEAGRALASIKESFPSLGDTDNRLISMGLELAEIERQLRGMMSETEFSESELENIDARISDIDRAVKKYGGSESSALEQLDRISAALEAAESYENELEELNREIELRENEVFEKASVLTQARKAAAQRLAEELAHELGELMMPAAVFEISVGEGSYTGTGCDSVEFLFSANPGQEPRPLIKIASGGELSRIMLAVKSVLSGSDSVGTAIFDEIDTGISGAAAERVGAKLKAISSGRQVVCVTHLAQIAAKADSHFLIRKQVEGDSTETIVTPLDREQRVLEVSRIISGGEPTEAVLKAASELIDRG